MQAAQPFSEQRLAASSLYVGCVVYAPWPVLFLPPLLHMAGSMARRISERAAADPVPDAECVHAVVRTKDAAAAGWTVVRLACEETAKNTSELTPGRRAVGR
jgi:hypothetical protein